MQNNDNYNRNRTYDGEKISVGLSGFTAYRTGHDDVDTPPPVGEILTPQDLAHKLSIFNQLLNTPELKEAIKLLKEHIEDMNNPHGVDLDQFMMDIGDALYAEFVKNGGSCSKERYLNSLFDTLYVASMEEMNNPIDRHAIISVSGATQFMRHHELDKNAHSGLIDHLFPGTPLMDDPMVAVYAFTGIPPSMMVDDYYQPDTDYSAFDLVPYSYVGHDGNVHYCNPDDDLPMDYIHGEPYIPLFGPRINHILESENLIPFKYHNVSVLHNAIASPDLNMTASAVNSSVDASEVLHMIDLPDVTITPGKHITFSVYAKAADCDKLGISYRDDTGSGITTVGVFHLVDGYSLVANPMESHSAHIHMLNNGWCRCSVTIYNSTGTTGTMKLIFFKGSDTDMDYRAMGETCGYLWGLQLEDGASVSPYMPTKGKKALRKAQFIQVPMIRDGETGRPKYTVSVATRGIGNNPSWSYDRVIFSILDKDRFPTAIAMYTDHESVLIERRSKLHTSAEGIFIGAPLYSSSFEIAPSPLLQTIHGTDQARIISGANEAIGEGVHAHDEWDTDSNLLIGTDGQGNYLDGYLRHASVYTFVIDKDEAKFLNGDQVNE